MKIHPAAGGKGPWRRVGPARGLQRNHPRQQRSVMTTPSATIRRSISPRPGQTLPHTFEAPMKQVRRTLPRLLRLLALTALLGTGAAQADDYTEITQLIKAGKPADALAKADQRLAANPRDPQLRFLRGVAQADSGKPADAITTFTKLTEEYPELPEPYNNLAVLYANQNQLDKARTALEMAIRTNPSYATAPCRGGHAAPSAPRSSAPCPCTDPGNHPNTHPRICAHCSSCACYRPSPHPSTRSHPGSSKRRRSRSGRDLGRAGMGGRLVGQRHAGLSGRLRQIVRSTRPPDALSVGKGALGAHRGQVQDQRAAVRRYRCGKWRQGPRPFPAALSR